VSATVSSLALLLAAIDPRNVLVLAVVLFGVGLVGVACRRNVLVILLSVEILLNAANLAFVAFSKIHGNVTGQVFVFFAMAIAAAEVAVGLAIVIAVYRLRRVVDANAASDLRERALGDVPPIVPEGQDAPHDDHGDAHAPAEPATGHASDAHAAPVVSTSHAGGH
jgi:NADH-quinone oxidoreductase subunit K